MSTKDLAYFSVESSGGTNIGFAFMRCAGALRLCGTRMGAALPMKSSLTPGWTHDIFAHVRLGIGNILYVRTRATFVRSCLHS